MGHVNDGGESRLRRGFATGAAAAFGGGGVGRCVGGDLLWRAERVRAMVRRDVCAQLEAEGENTGRAKTLVSKNRPGGDTYDSMSPDQGKQRDMDATTRRIIGDRRHR